MKLVWEEVFNGIEDGKTVKEVPDSANFIAVLGTVTMVRDTSTGGIFVVLSDTDDPSTELPVFLEPNMLADEIGIGTEVIAIGRVYKSNDDRKVMNGYGLIVNPDTQEYAVVMEELDEILW